MPAQIQYRNTIGMAVLGSPSQVRFHFSSPSLVKRSFTIPNVLSNMKEKDIVKITMEIMEGIKNTTRNALAPGTFLWRKKATTMEIGRRIKFVTGINHMELMKDRFRAYVVRISSKNFLNQ